MIDITMRPLALMLIETQAILSNIKSYGIDKKLFVIWSTQVQQIFNIIMLFVQ